MLLYMIVVRLETFLSASECFEQNHNTWECLMDPDWDFGKVPQIPSMMVPDVKFHLSNRNFLTTWKGSSMVDFDILQLESLVPVQLVVVEGEYLFVEMVRGE